MNRRTPLKRHAPPRSRAKLQTTKPLRRKVAVKHRNEKRLGKRREVEFAISSGYRDHTIKTPCAACGSFDPEVGSQPAHVGRTRGAGAKADHVLPLCPMCHIWEGERRNEFNEAFRLRHGVTPEDMALYRYETYHRENA